MTPHDISRTISLAIETKRNIEELELVLDRCKNELRAHAIDLTVHNQLDGDSTVKIAGAAGVASVTFIKDRFCLKEGFTPESIRKLVAPEMAAILIEDRPVLRSDAEAAFKAQALAAQALLTGFVRWEPQTPRVVLPK